MKLENLIGHKFGRLTVFERAENDKNGNARWLCKCECGNEHTVQAQRLKNGNTKSCGCYRREFMSTNTKTHGMAKTKLYKEWRRMKERCFLKTKEGYERYGGRGITVCPEWRDSFENFRDWALANGYREDLTLDRINNDGPYSPENCRWATVLEQANNKSNNRMISYAGRTQTLAQWAREIGLRRDTLRYRLENGWTLERALTEPKDPKRAPIRKEKKQWN